AALAAAKPLWFTGQSTPDACEPLFAALFTKGELTNADRHARFRLATEAGSVRLAQALAADFPAQERIATAELATIERDPLRALAWSDVRKTIDGLPERDQQEPTWRYWKARALAELGKKEDADALYAIVATGIHFYGLLAAEALGRGVEQLAALKSEPAMAS